MQKMAKFVKISPPAKCSVRRPIVIPIASLSTEAEIKHQGYGVADTSTSPGSRPRLDTPRLAGKGETARGQRLPDSGGEWIAHRIWVAWTRMIEKPRVHNASCFGPLSPRGRGSPAPPRPPGARRSALLNTHSLLYRTRASGVSRVVSAVRAWIRATSGP